MSLRKRFFTRHPISLDVSVRQSKGWVHYRTVDVSRRGVFLRTDNPSPLHRLLQMRIELSGEDTLDVMGRVRRSAASREESAIGPGMGIEFFVMSAAQQDAWDRFVLSQPRGDPGHAPGEGSFTSGAAVPDDVVLPDEQGLHAGPSDERTVVGIPRGDAQAAVAAGREELRAHQAELTAAASAAAAAPPSDAPLHVIIRPATRKELDGFVVRRLACRPVLMRVDEPAQVGQSVTIVLVHPETDCEYHLQATVQRTVDAQSDHGAGIQVGFKEAKSDLRTDLRRYVELGTLTEPPAPEGKVNLHDTLVDRANTRPGSATAQTELGWSFIAQRQVPESAIDAFLAALVIDGDRREAHRGLSLAYALTGDAHRAYAFASSWRQLEQRRESAESP